MSEYPAHDALKALSAQADAIGGFLDWLRERRIGLARWTDIEGLRDPRLMLIRDTPEQLIGEFLGISSDDLEREKRAMLEAIHHVGGDESRQP